ncbi:HutD family protein [Kitasatospora terrestris]|uniref:HutD-family protein n=1 Tax=Kitasatospora terrestris TaxID=258051 RepID=A0ABP9DL66_9ACTN
MTLTLLRAADRVATAWLNGGGTTREIAGHPADAGPADFAWRASLADVARGGPFSRFPDSDRVLTVVDGEGVLLTVDGTEHHAEPYRPFAFPGDADTDCRLPAGPVVAFNVMTRRGRARATVDLVRTARPVDVPADADVLLVCLTGTAVVGGTRLGRFDAALLPPTSRHPLAVDGTTAVVTLRTR